LDSAVIGEVVIAENSGDGVGGCASWLPGRRGRRVEGKAIRTPIGGRPYSMMYCAILSLSDWCAIFIVIHLFMATSFHRSYGSSAVPRGPKSLKMPDKGWWACGVLGSGADSTSPT